MLTWWPTEDLAVNCQKEKNADRLGTVHDQVFETGDWIFRQAEQMSAR